MQRGILEQDRERTAGVEPADDPSGLLSFRKLTGNRDLDVRLRREFQQRGGKLLGSDVKLSLLLKVNRPQARPNARGNE